VCNLAAKEGRVPVPQSMRISSGDSLSQEQKDLLMKFVNLMQDKLMKVSASISIDAFRNASFNKIVLLSK
jgi:hypothetical protein